MKQSVRSLGILASLLFSASSAFAAVTANTTSTTMGVSATVNAYCAINSAASIGFTAFNPNAGDQNASSSISVNCTNTTPFDIGLSLGNGTNASLTTGRIMTNGSNTLAYQLYSDSGYRNVWGDTVGTNTVRLIGAGFGTDTAKTATVYAKIPSQPNAVPAAYSDTVTVTVTY